MRSPIERIVAGWLELARKAGFFLLLVAGCAALGFAIAWPLWYFATMRRGSYTILVLCLAVAGLAGLVIRALIHRRGAPRETGKPRRRPLFALLSALKALLLLAGLYVIALLFLRGLWLPAIPVLLAWVALLGWIGFGRGAPGAR